MTAPERVEVVETDGEGGAEAFGNRCAEHVLAVERHEQPEADLDRLVAAEQDAALGRNQLVRPGEVRRIGLDPEPLAQPLTAPGAGKEGRPGAERPLRERSERGPEDVADDGAETSGVGRVDVAVERGANASRCRSRIGQSTNSSRFSEPRAPGGCPRLARSPRRTASRLARFGTSTYQRRSCSTSAAPGPWTSTTPSSGSRGDPSRSSGSVRALSFPKTGRRRARFRRCAVEPPPTTRSGLGCRRRGRRATRRAPGSPRSMKRPGFRRVRRPVPLGLRPRRRAARGRAQPRRRQGCSAAQGRTSRIRSSVSAALHEKTRLPSGAPVAGS